MFEIGAATASSEAIGLALQINPNTLQIIKYNHPSDCEAQLSDIVSEWLQGRGSDCTWFSLSQALRNPLVQRPDLARNIETKYGPCSTMQHLTSHTLQLKLHPDDSRDVSDVNYLTLDHIKPWNVTRERVYPSKHTDKIHYQIIMHMPSLSQLCQRVCRPLPSAPSLNLMIRFPFGRGI